MVSVFIINLKDNRENHDKNDDIKFETCMRNHNQTADLHSNRNQNLYLY